MSGAAGPDFTDIASMIVYEEETRAEAPASCTPDLYAEAGPRAEAARSGRRERVVIAGSLNKLSLASFAPSSMPVSLDMVVLSADDPCADHQRRCTLEMPAAAETMQVDAWSKHRDIGARRSKARFQILYSAQQGSGNDSSRYQAQQDSGRMDTTHPRSSTYLLDSERGAEHAPRLPDAEVASFRPPPQALLAARAEAMLAAATHLSQSDLYNDSSPYQAPSGTSDRPYVRQSPPPVVEMPAEESGDLRSVRFNYVSGRVESWP